MVYCSRQYHLLFVFSILSADLSENNTIVNDLDRSKFLLDNFHSPQSEVSFQLGCLRRGYFAFGLELDSPLLDGILWEIVDFEVVRLDLNSLTIGRVVVWPCNLIRDVRLPGITLTFWRWLSIVSRTSGVTACLN